MRPAEGTAANRVSTAAVLDVFTKSNKGKTYYYYEVLTAPRTATRAAVTSSSPPSSPTNPHNMKLQSGDKRWFKGQERDLKQSWSSFTVA